MINILIYFISAIVLLIDENDEHAKCLNVWFFFRCMVTMYASFASKHFILVYINVHVHGAGFPDR